MEDKFANWALACRHVRGKAFAGRASERASVEYKSDELRADHAREH